MTKFQAPNKFQLANHQKYFGFKIWELVIIWLLILGDW